MSQSDHEAGAPVLRVRDLTVRFPIEGGFFNAVDGVSFSAARQRTLAIVGESGSGKTVSGLALMGLLPRSAARNIRGRIELSLPGGTVDLATLPERRLCDLRGSEIAMIFQEPMTSLNPVHTVGQQISEAILLHQSVSKSVARDKSVELLELVGISDPRRRMDAYPHEMSGGMRQRVMIAIALACSPKVLIADEPTTALDVTIQAQILDLIRELQMKLGMAVVFITHDLGVVAEVADEVCVMYAGQVVEQGSVDQVLRDPRHPYTIGLIRSRPEVAEGRRLYSMPGRVPGPGEARTGCVFSNRCPWVVPEVCKAAPPSLEKSGDRTVRCFRHDEISAREASA